MPMPSDEAPDYLPDGSISIHGKLARKMTINQRKGKNGKTIIDVSTNHPSMEEMMKRMNEDMDKAYRGE